LTDSIFLQSLRIALVVRLENVRACIALGFSGRTGAKLETITWEVREAVFYFASRGKQAAGWSCSSRFCAMSALAITISCIELPFIRICS
jgi:hypothetical protein